MNNNVVNEGSEVLEAQQSWETALENERSVYPLVDVYEKEDGFVLSASMPGVAKENVHLKLEDGLLTIFGKINFNDVVRRKYIFSESYFANYLRSFKISDSIDGSKIEAQYENGQLLVTLPKKDSAKPRNININ